MKSGFFVHTICFKQNCWYVMKLIRRAVYEKIISIMHHCDDVYDQCIVSTDFQQNKVYATTSGSVGENVTFKYDAST